MKRGDSQVDQDTDDDSGNSSSMLSPEDDPSCSVSSSHTSRTWKANKNLKQESLEMAMFKKKYRDWMMEVEDGYKHQYHPCHDDHCLPVSTTRSPFALCNHSVHTMHPDTPRPGVNIRRRHLASRGDVHKAKRSLRGLFPLEVCLPPHLVDGTRKKLVPLMDIANTA